LVRRRKTYGRRSNGFNGWGRQTGSGPILGSKVNMVDLGNDAHMTFRTTNEPFTNNLVSVAREKRKRWAAKADNAEVPEYLWLEHLLDDGSWGWHTELKDQLATIWWGGSGSTCSDSGKERFSILHSKFIPNLSKFGTGFG
jgi:hypothetical protein